MNYRVKVNGKDIPVYEEKIYPAPYNSTAMMECAMFFMDGTATVEIESEIPVKSVVVRPLSYNIKPQIDGNVIRIRLDSALKFSVEINGSEQNNLAVFAQEDRGIDFEYENLLKYEQGEYVQEIFDITKSNSVVYLDKDAVLKGKVLIHDCENVVLCGFGKVTMTDTEWGIKPSEKRRAVEVINCRNVTVRDIRISDSVDWSLRVMGSENVVIDNVKIIGCRGNSDGIDVCGSRNVLVKNIFTRTWDDSFVLKALDTGDAENVTFCDSVLWNDFARPIEVGVELRADNVKDITFRNIDIIHSPTGYPLMGIHHGDRAKVRNIVFEDIRIEDTPGAQLFDIRMANSVWNRDPKMGDISGILIKNVEFIGKPGLLYAMSKSRIEGYSSEHTVRDITVENLKILGKTATTPAEAGLDIMDFVEDVKFKFDSDAEKINLVRAELSPCGEFLLGSDGLYSANLKARIINEGEKAASGRVWLWISPVNTAFYDSKPYEYNLAPKEVLEIDYSVKMQPGKYYFCIQSDSPDVNAQWFYKKLDFVLEAGRDISAQNEFVISNYYGDKEKISLAISDDILYIKSDVLKDKNNSVIVYAAMPAKELPGEVKFSVEETDFGVVPALILGRNGIEPAPQLRCPAEITYVFKNEPKVKKITKCELKSESGIVSVTLSELGVCGRNFWLEIEAKTDKVSAYRYPFTLFHSVKPEDTAHMFGNIVIK